MKRSFIRSLWGAPVLSLVALLALASESGRPDSQPDPAPQVCEQIFCKQFSFKDRAISPELKQKLQAANPKRVKDTAGRIWQATTKGLFEITTAQRKKLWTGKDGLPVLNLTALAAGSDGSLWIGSSEGAICFKPEEPPERRWFFFWGKRYLPDNAVQSIAAEQGRAWIRTKTGISLIEFKPYDMDQKSAYFDERIQKRHRRYGYVADCDLTRPGDPNSFRLAPTDNDGLWTALYVAAECFRYAATRSPEALRNARVSLAALIRLESITGISGFPARALIHKGDYRDPDGEWHWTVDGEWEWKGDTSSDELVGHFFAYHVAYELLPDEADRQAIRPVVSRMAHHLLDHGLNLVGAGGHATRWGRYSPEYFQTPDGKADCTLNSLEILSHLLVAYHVSRETSFLVAYRHLIDDLGYLRNVAQFATATPSEVNYSDHELAYLAFYPALELEHDSRLKLQYQQALDGLWQQTKNEKCPLWDFIYAAGHGPGKDFAFEAALDSLQRIPMDTISWTVRNSQRVDLEMDPSRGRFEEMQARHPIPPNERSVMKWNGNPFELDGGDGGRSEDDGAFFLLPFWIGRYYGFIRK